MFDVARREAKRGASRALPACSSTGFTPFELLYGYQVRTTMTLLKRLWRGDNEDPEVKTSYQYVVGLKHRVEETCELAKNELAKVQTRNQKYYN